MGFLGALFGGGGDEPDVQPMPEPEEQRQDIDPNLDNALAEARKTRASLDARTGRSDLVTSRSGVSIVGGNV
jgi:hypothetical protein